MNAVSRLLTLSIVAVASTASLIEMWPQLGPQSDLWRVADYLRRIDGLSDESDQLDSQNALLQRLAAARTHVMDALRGGRLTAAQAVDRFVDLDSMRTEARLVDSPQTRGLSATERARAEVLSLLRQSLKGAPVSPDGEAYARVLRELEGSAPINVHNASLN
jgi:hypothetical protein